MGLAISLLISPASAYGSESPETTRVQKDQKPTNPAKIMTPRPKVTPDPPAVPGSGESPRLTFSVISDIHIRNGKSDWGYPYRDVRTEVRFRHALTDLHQIDPSQQALVLNGDLTTTGQQSDYDLVANILKSTQHPKLVLSSIGNHEFYSAYYDKNGRRKPMTFPNGITEKECISRFLKNTAMEGVYYDRWIEGYHFIILGSTRSIISNRWLGNGAYLSEQQLEWLAAKLRESAPYSPIFVFLHQPIPGTVPDSHPHYVIQAEELKHILSAYPQVVLFSGHTHSTLKPPYNPIYQDGFTMVNDSSVADPKFHHQHLADSEGLYVQVFPDRVVIRSRDFTHGSWIKTYVLPAWPSPVRRDLKHPEPS